MELPGANYLYALATISVTFVGFSALLLVFRQTIGGKMTSYGYDPVGQITQLIEGFGSTVQRTTTSVFDLVGNVTKITDPLGHISSMSYDVRDRVTRIMARLPDRKTVVRYTELEVVVDRTAARFAAWYEMVPRSQGTDPTRGSTFAEAEKRLPEIRDLGFDVIYFTPIHPIGRTNRKGRNNATRSQPGDPGSRVQMSNIALGGSDGAPRRLSISRAKDFAKRGDLDRVTELRPGAMGFNIADAAGINTGNGKRLGYHRRLPVHARRRVSNLVRTVIVDGRASDHRMNPVVVGKSLRIQGFIVSNYANQRPQFLADMTQWIGDGRIASEETVEHGIENAPKAFINLFSGGNTGKMLVKLG